MATIPELYAQLNALRAQLAIKGKELNRAKTDKERAGVELYNCESMNTGGRDYAQDSCDIALRELNELVDAYYATQKQYNDLKKQIDKIRQAISDLQAEIQGSNLDKQSVTEPKNTNTRTTGGGAPASQREPSQSDYENNYGLTPDNNEPDRAEDVKETIKTIGAKKVNLFGQDFTYFEVGGFLFGMVMVGFALAFPIENPLKSKK